MSDFPSPPAPYQPQSVAQQAPRNGPGIAALILGIIGGLSALSALVLWIIGVLSGVVPFFFWVAGILGIIGLFLGLVGMAGSSAAKPATGRRRCGESSPARSRRWSCPSSAR